MKKINCVYGLRVIGICRYVGSGELESRKSNHFARLRNGTHIKELQELYNSLGENAFEFIVFEKCNKSDLYEREDYYKKIYDDTIFNVNNISNTKKKVRRGKEAKNHKEKFRELFSGEKNPNCTKLDKNKVFEILDMINSGVNKEVIAEKYNLAKNYIYRIGRDRWVNEFIEWKIEKADCTGIQPTFSANEIAQLNM